MRTLLLSFALVFVIASCNKKTEENSVTEENTTTEESYTGNSDTMVVVNDTVEVNSETTEQLYACSMHPEVQGKKNAECSKCGMELTELVTKE